MAKSARETLTRLRESLRRVQSFIPFETADLIAKYDDLAAQLVEDVSTERQGRLLHESLEKRWRDKATTLEAENARLRDEVAVLNGSACNEERIAGNGPCGICTQCYRERIAHLTGKERGDG